MRQRMNDLGNAFRLESVVMKSYRSYFWLSFFSATFVALFTSASFALAPLYAQLFFSGFLGIFTAHLFVIQRKHRLSWLYHILPPKQAVFITSRFLFVGLHHLAGVLLSLLAYQLTRSSLSLSSFLLCLSGGLFLSICLVAVQLLLLYTLGMRGQPAATIIAMLYFFALFTESSLNLSWGRFLPDPSLLIVAEPFAPLILLFSIVISLLILIAAAKVAILLQHRRSTLE